MFLYGLRRLGCKGKKQNTTVPLLASLAAAIIGVVATFVGKTVNDDGPPKEFPWLALGIAGAGLMILGAIAFVAWRRKLESRNDSEEDGPCSR